MTTNNEEYIVYGDLISGMQTVIDNWGEDGKKLVELGFNQSRFNGNFDSFLSHCAACGGNWSAMLLTGIHELWPEVWEAIPDEMGPRSFVTLVGLLRVLGVDTRN